MQQRLVRVKSFHKQSWLYCPPNEAKVLRAKLLPRSQFALLPLSANTLFSTDWDAIRYIWLVTTT